MDTLEQLNETSGSPLSLVVLASYFGGLFILYMLALWVSGQGKHFDSSGMWMFAISIFWAIVIGAVQAISNGSAHNPFH